MFQRAVLLQDGRVGDLQVHQQVAAGAVDVAAVALGWVSIKLSFCVVFLSLTLLHFFIAIFKVTIYTLERALLGSQLTTRPVPRIIFKLFLKSLPGLLPEWWSCSGS